MPNCNKLHHQSGRRSDETMDDDSDDKDSKRKSRNLSEKKRRDQFNLLVNELSAMVSTSGRKMDKSTVLKATISFLKSHNELAVRSKINEIQEDWKPTFLTNEEFTHLVLEAVDGFIIIFSTSGQIYYASESTTSLLGYLPKDILDISIFDLVCEEDHTYLYDILATPHEDEQISFSCHLKRCWSQFEKATFFELVNIFGYFRPDESTTNKASGVDTPSSSDSNKNLVFVGTAKIQTPLLIKEMPLIDSIIRSEFTSRHSLEWKFLFLDHRAPPIIGYLPFELLGTSGYEYYHVDDLEKVINCHEKLMQKGEGTSCYYRFLTKGQQWIWLQTRFYITYHQWNSKPEFVVCTHRVVNYLDVTNKSRKESVHHHHHHLQSSSSIRDHDVETHQSTSSAAAWRSSSKSRRNSTKKRQDSDSTSMSADSPTSKYSTVTEKSINKSHVSLMGNLSVSSSPHPLQEANNLRKSHESLNSSPTADGGVGILHQHQQQEQQFLEPVQYGTTINNSLHHQPSSSALESYPAHSLSTQVEETVHQNEIQVDFHRKQAELQAIIGQQQQELLRVSEQLLMARLALFQQQTTQEQIISQQSGEQSYQPSNSPVTVSSTTATSSAASISVPTVSLAETDPLQPATILYTLADSNSNNTQN